MDIFLTFKIVASLSRKWSSCLAFSQVQSSLHFFIFSFRWKNKWHEKERPLLGGVIGARKFVISYMGRLFNSWGTLMITWGKRDKEIKTYLFGRKANWGKGTSLFFIYFSIKNEVMFMFIIALYLLTCLKICSCQDE